MTHTHKYTCAQPDLVRREAQFTYVEGDEYVFMDQVGVLRLNTHTHTHTHTQTHAHTHIHTHVLFAGDI